VKLPPNALLVAYNARPTVGLSTHASIAASTVRESFEIVAPEQANRAIAASYHEERRLHAYVWRRNTVILWPPRELERAEVQSGPV
jgi:hypothetical protein